MFWGATSNSEDVNNNVFTFNAGNVSGNYIAAAYAANGNATGNILNLNGGTFIDISSFFGANANTGAYNNIVNIGQGVNFPSGYFFIHGGYSPNADNNTINVNGDIDNTQAHLAAGNSDNATNNTVNINSGNIKLSHILGAFSNNLVSGNKVNINSGNITTINGITGGYIISSTGIAQNNEINITGGSVSGIVRASMGGYSATGNVINISGSPDLTNSSLYGYTNENHSGNTLNLYSKNITAQNIANFDNINFYVPSDAVNGDTMLTLTDSAGTVLSDTTIRAGVVEGNSSLAVGDTINLITNANGLTTNNTNWGILTEGVSLNYNLNLSNSGNSIIATVGEGNLISGTQLFPLSSEIAGVGIANVTMDTKTLPAQDNDENDGGNVNDASNVPMVEPKGWEIFANMGGGSLRTKGSDGSHVDMTTQSINLGFARSLENSAGRFTIAPIIDYANGNYDSYLETGIHGSGKTRYIAGGLIARRMLQNGFYYETSVRLGRVKTDFSSDDLDKTGAFGKVTYDTSATTISGHLKLGKAMRLNKNNLLDVYGIYYHAHQNGMGADLSSGEHYDFSSANSGRFRIGYRLTTRTSKISKIYTGLAYQYEHATGVTASYKTYSTPSEGESGSSGMLELGWIVKPLKALPWAVDINTTGWIGHQRGITAMAKIVKSF